MNIDNPIRPLTEEERARLQINIEADGVLDAVELCAECGALLDGHNRTAIADELGIDCPTRDVKLPICSPDAHWAWAVKRNVDHRQLSSAEVAALHGQRKERAAVLRETLTQEQTANLLGVSQQAVAKWEARSNTTGGNAPADRRRKLTDDDIAAVVERLKTGETQQSIADDYEVDQTRISQIAREHAHVIVPLPYEVAGVEVRCEDARDYHGDEYADLAFFSPPYNVGIAYDADLNGDALPDAEWRELIASTLEVLRDGWQVGRIVINVPAALDRNPYRPVELPAVEGLDLEGVIVWDKGTTGNRTTWGSWRQPTAPALRDRTERLYVYRTPNQLRGVDDALVVEGDKRVSKLISSAQFTSLTQDVWQVAPASAQSIGHPAPFPNQLAENVIRLYGWEGCTVIDPFAGSGSTGLAAASLGCRGVLIDQSESYCRLALKRLMEAFG